LQGTEIIDQLSEMTYKWSQDAKERFIVATLLRELGVQQRLMDRINMRQFDFASVEHLSQPPDYGNHAGRVLCGCFGNNVAIGRQGHSCPAWINPWLS